MRKGARLALVLATVLFPVVLFAGTAEAVSCQECHESVTKGVVIDWLQSRHAKVDVTCDTCHGGDHNSADDVAKATMPTPDTCAQCHEQQTAQYKKGKHALAWAALNAMPTTHAMPKVLSDGLKGCGGCHKVGLMTPEQIKTVRAQAGGRGRRPAIHATPGTRFQRPRRGSPRPAGPATWASTTRSGRCTRAPSTACAMP